jgi:hypothetical protein
MNLQSLYAFLEKREILSDDAEKELEFLKEKYPWFGGAHLLHALLKRKNRSLDAETYLSKAQLYLSNPLWANWHVMNLDFDKIPEKKEEEVLSFEPLHSIDYFASQGIRLKSDQLGNDALSNQVKTFTQWLQTMKKIYHKEQGGAEKTEDINITIMADASNETKEIVTETMADVLIQQGKKSQAIAILKKLSLLHPEKSSYFTARISELSK